VLEKLLLLIYTDDPPTNKTATPVFENFEFKDITALNSKSAGRFNCLPESPCTNLNLNTIDIKSEKGFSCDNAYGKANKCSPKWCGK